MLTTMYSSGGNESTAPPTGRAYEGCSEGGYNTGYGGDANAGGYGEMEEVVVLEVNR